MSPGKRSPRLAGPILKQTHGHPGVAEPATEPSGSPPGDEHDLLVAQLEVDLVAWVWKIEEFLAVHDPSER